MFPISQNNRPRVRIGRNYAINFNIAHGQKTVDLVVGPTNPLQKLHPGIVSVSIGEPGYDLIHTFNSIPILTRTPFVTTFESLMPRLTSENITKILFKHLTNRIADRQCRALIAMSDYAIRQMKFQHSNSEIYQSLQSKVQVVYPAIQAADTKPKCANSEISLLFVGNDYFRKGGPSVVAAHNRLKHQGVGVRTVIVSNLNWSMGDYIGPPDAEYVRKEIKKIDESGVIHYRNLPNEKVKSLMREADYLLLPTLHDTFGYVALEAMAVGTPVVSSSTCALPEIIEDGVSGYLLPFENDAEIGKWIYLSETDPHVRVNNYKTTIEDLSRSLSDTLTRLVAAREDYEHQSAAAISRIQSRFSKNRARDQLDTIYAAALSRSADQ